MVTGFSSAVQRSEPGIAFTVRLAELVADLPGRGGVHQAGLAGVRFIRPSRA